MDFCRIHVAPSGVGGVVAGDGDEPAARGHSNALDHQTVIGAQDIDPVAQPQGLVGGIDENLVATTERRFHRIPGHPDDRQVGGLGGGQAPEPALVEPEPGIGVFL